MILKNTAKTSSKYIQSLLTIFLFIFLIISSSSKQLSVNAFTNEKIKADIIKEKDNLVIVIDKSVKDNDPKKVRVISKDEFANIKDKSNLTIEKNGRSYLETIPDDTYYSNNSNNYAYQGVLLDSWNLRDINLNPTDEAPASAWKTTTGSSNTIVATIDTGIDITHVDLIDNLWINPGEIGPTTLENPIPPNCTSGSLPLDKSCNGIDDDGNGFVDDVNGYNFADNESNVTDTIGHGTHVAGIIAGRGNNGIGVAGVCWTCKIMALKVINSEGFASDTDVAKAIDYAVLKGAKVINISLGGGSTSTLIDTAAKNAFDQGVLVVGAAGNTPIDIPRQDSSDSYPGAAIYTISVGSSYVTNVNDPLSNFSNYGQRMDILAPGGQVGQEGVVSAYMREQNLVNQYAVMRGTSMSSPHVVGTAALLYDYHRLDTTPWGAKEVRYALLKKATDIVNVPNGYTVGFDSNSGFGKLDANASLNTLNSEETFLSADVTNPVATLNTLVNPIVSGTVDIIGSVNDTNLYIYTVYFQSVSNSTIVMQRSGRNNINNGNLLSFDTRLLADSDYKVYARAEDFTGNFTYSNEIDIKVNNFPTPFSLISPVNDSFINSQNPLLNWTVSTETGSNITYDVYINNSQVAGGLVENSFQTSSNFVDGSVNTWYVIAKDNASNTTQSPTNQFTIDLSPPVLSNTSVLVDRFGVTISISATDSQSGISSYQISLDGNGFTSFNPPYTNTLLADGIHSFVIRVFNNALGYSEYSGTFNIITRRMYLISKADFNLDGKVDLSDLSILAQYWQQTVTIADANFDGKVDLSDLSILASDWNKSY